MEPSNLDRVPPNRECWSSVTPLLVWKERNPVVESGNVYRERFPNRSDVATDPEWAFECVLEMRFQVRILEFELSRKIGAALTNKYVLYDIGEQFGVMTSVRLRAANLENVPKVMARRLFDFMKIYGAIINDEETG